jgi:hypothetical protein
MIFVPARKKLMTRTMYGMKVAQPPEKVIS